MTSASSIRITPIYRLLYIIVACGIGVWFISGRLTQSLSLYTLDISRQIEQRIDISSYLKYTDQVDDLVPDNDPPGEKYNPKKPSNGQGQQKTSASKHWTQGLRSPDRNDAVKDQKQATNKSNATNKLGHLTGKTKVNITKLLLVTYFRGGSTFLGQLFNQNKNVFYWFEPFATAYNDEIDTLGMGGDASGVKLYWDPDGTQSAVRRQYKQTIQNLTQAIYTCQIDQIDRSTLKHNFITQWRKSISFSMYLMCMTHRKLDGYTDEQKFSDASVDHCRHLIEPPCNSAHTRVIKTIRLPMFLVEQLLLKDSSLKVIYYTRDPRGIFSSRWNINYGKPSDIRKKVAHQCQAMAQDFALAQSLQKQLPKRVMVLRYEDLAGDPSKYSQNIYDFLGQSMPKEVSDWLTANTQAKTLDGAWGTARNSSQVIDNWKKELDIGHIYSITKACNETLQLIGYDTNLTGLRSKYKQ